MRRSGRWSEVRARFLDGGEYESAWQGFVAANRIYAVYGEAATRPIPLVVLEDG